MNEEETPSARMLKVSRRPKPQYQSTFPEIRLNGKWLAELGFHIGRHVKVEREENNLIITLLEMELPKTEVNTRKRKSRSANSYCASCFTTFKKAQGHHYFIATDRSPR